MSDGKHPMSKAAPDTMTSTTPRAASAAAPGNGRARRSGEAIIPPGDGVSFETILEWHELDATIPELPQSFGVRLKAGTFKSYTRDGDITIVSPTAPIESGNAVLVWINGRGPVLCRVRIPGDGIAKLIPEDITQPAIPARPGDIAWMLRVTALYHFIS